MLNLEIKISKDFTKYPGSGFRKDHSEDGYSGEEFLEKLFLPSLIKRASHKYESLIIDFDGVAGIHPSFLEEGIINLSKIISAEICLSLLFSQKLVFKSKEYAEEIKRVKEVWIEQEKEDISCLVDDCRNMNCDFICRSGEAAVKVIPLLKNKINVLYLDYDLDLFLTGLDVITRLDCLNCLPNIIHIVSTHPTGVEKIRKYLKDNKFNALTNNTFFRRGQKDV